MNQTENEDKSIFVHIDLIDNMSWQDACTHTSIILITSSRDDTFHLRSKFQQFKNVAHLAKYEFNEKRIEIMKQNKIETVVLLQVKGYNELAVALINNGFSVKILEMSVTNILDGTESELLKHINRSKDYYIHWFDIISKKTDIIVNTTSLEIEIVNLIRKLDFSKLDHVQFNYWLIQMIQLENGYGEPLLFNFIRRAVITTYNTAQTKE